MKEIAHVGKGENAAWGGFATKADGIRNTNFELEGASCPIPAEETERCPWCGSAISRTKFLEIESKIRKEANDRLKDAEAQMRTQLQEQFKRELREQKSAVEKKAQENAERRISQLASERDALDSKLKEVKAKESRIRAQAKAELEAEHEQEIAKLKQGIEKERDAALLRVQAQHNRERESFQKKIKAMEQQLEKKTANQLGDEAEIDVFQALTNAFPEDRIARVRKGQAGADIVAEVIYKGQSCGRMIIDSKNRQAWQNSFVSKLRQDQVDAEAEHAILATSVFPRGKKELTIESDVIVVNPEMLIQIVRILREAMIAMHIRGLSLKERSGKMSRLYDLVTSESFSRQFSEAVKLTDDMVQLDAQEKKAHDNLWKKRGTLVTRMNNTLREIDTSLNAIIEGEPGEYSEEEHSREAA